MDKASLLYIAGVIPLGAVTVAFAGAGWWLAAICSGLAAATMLLLARRAVAERGMPGDDGEDDAGR